MQIFDINFVPHMRAIDGIVVIYGNSSSPRVITLNRFMEEKQAEKTVLMHVGVRVRPIKFSGTKADLTSAIKLNFSDVLSDDAPFFIQVSRAVPYPFECRSLR